MLRYLYHRRLGFHAKHVRGYANSTKRSPSAAPDPADQIRGITPSDHCTQRTCNQERRNRTQRHRQIVDGRGGAAFILSKKISNDRHHRWLHSGLAHPDKTPRIGDLGDVFGGSRNTVHGSPPSSPQRLGDDDCI